MNTTAASRGVLLTLGITFLSLIVLSFATLILRNAENSDVRLTELSSIDRLYTLGSSLERSLGRSYYALTGINLTLNNDTITLVKDTKRQGSPNYFALPEITDSSILTMKSSNIYVKLLAESLTYKTTTLDDPLGLTTFINYLTLFFYYPKYEYDSFKTNALMIYGYTDDKANITKDYNFRHTAAGAPYCCLEINNNTGLYPINSTYQIFLLGNNLSELKEINIKARHPTRCPSINWSNSGTRRLNEANNGYEPDSGDVKVKITVTVQNEDAARPCTPLNPPDHYYEIQADAILNRTNTKTTTNITLPQIIFLDNLTDDTLFPGYDFIYDPNTPPYTFTPSKERPAIIFYDQLAQGETGTPIAPTASNILYLIQYDNPIRWEVTLKYSMGPIEVYSTETVSSSLSALSVSRVHRPARFK